MWSRDLPQQVAPTHPASLLASLPPSALQPLVSSPLWVWGPREHSPTQKPMGLFLSQRNRWRESLGHPGGSDMGSHGAARPWGSPKPALPSLTDLQSLQVCRTPGRLRVHLPFFPDGRGNAAPLSRFCPHCSLLRPCPARPALHSSCWGGASI